MTPNLLSVVLQTSSSTTERLEGFRFNGFQFIDVALSSLLYVIVFLVYLSLAWLVVRPLSTTLEPETKRRATVLFGSIAIAVGLIVAATIVRA